MDIVRLEYGYDRSGNRLYRRDEVARSQTPLAKYDELYGYDGLNRLTSFDRGELNVGNTGLTGSPTLTQDWTLDGTGNWSGFSQTVQSPLTQTRTHNPVNEITGIGETVGTAWPDPAYDANGNATSFPKPASLGNGMTATYDAWNRLVKVADSGGTVAEYRYDGLNRRTEKIAGGTTRHDYFSDQWQTLEERTGSSTSADRQFVWGQRYVDDLVLRDRTSERLYALQDALFNVVALTSNTGAVQERFAYQPYGQSESLDPDFSTYTGTDLNWEYRFTGRELDFESGLQINRNRYLHLQLGRWITRDPIGYLFKDVSLSAYVRNSPTRRQDASGLFSVEFSDFTATKCAGKCRCIDLTMIIQMTKNGDAHLEGDFVIVQAVREYAICHKCCATPNDDCIVDPKSLKVDSHLFYERLTASGVPLAVDSHAAIGFDATNVGDCAGRSTGFLMAVFAIVKIFDRGTLQLPNPLPQEDGFAEREGVGVCDIPLSAVTSAVPSTPPSFWNSKPADMGYYYYVWNTSCCPDPLYSEIVTKGWGAIAVQ